MADEGIRLEPGESVAYEVSLPARPVSPPTVTIRWKGRRGNAVPLGGGYDWEALPTPLLGRAWMFVSGRYTRTYMGIRHD